MKKYNYFILLLLFAACSKDVEPEGASFRLEFYQSGGYSKYFRFIGLDPNMVIEGTDVVPLTLEGKDLNESQYIFVTSKPINMFSPSFIVSSGDADSSAVFTFRVFKNGELIDIKVIEAKADDMPKNFAWDYKSNEL